METFFFPIRGLTMPAPWNVGSVVVRPRADGLAAVTAQLSDAAAEQFEGELRDNEQTVAEVVADNRDQALEQVAQAVDVLRVYQHVRFGRMRLTQFDVAGDVPAGGIAYARAGGDRGGHGFVHRGEYLGWQFSDSDDWRDSAAFQFVAGAIGHTDPSEGEQRALVGVQMLSQALIEQRSAFKIVNAVTALEAWLMPRHGAGKTFRFARAVSYFACGSRCGRETDTCLYLASDPDQKSGVKKLKRLRDRGSSPPWRCSQWHDAVDWYEIRSGVVHGAGFDVDAKEASSGVFIVARYLAEPVLQWLASHPDSPVAQLEDAIKALPPSPDWEQRLGPL